MAIEFARWGNQMTPVAEIEPVVAYAARKLHEIPIAASSVEIDSLAAMLRLIGDDLRQIESEYLDSGNRTIEATDEIASCYRSWLASARAIRARQSWPQVALDTRERIDSCVQHAASVVWQVASATDGESRLAEFDRNEPT